MTLDPDVESLLRRAMLERGVPFKRALNDAIRAGVAGPPEAAAVPTRVAAMGLPRVDLDAALRLSADDEDDELARRLRLHQ